MGDETNGYEKDSRARDDDRDRERDRRDDRDGHRERERDRERDRDRDKDRKRSKRSRSKSRDKGDRRRKHRSRSPSRKSRSRSESRSRTPPRRRKTGFDQPPPGGVVAPIIPTIAAAAVVAPVLGFGAGLATAMFPGVQPPSQQATRHARRVYVGGLPPTANEQNIATFFSNALAAVGGTTAGPGPCVVNVYINYEKKFAFVEFRTVEETSNAMALDGIMFEGVSVRVRRPNDYNPAAAAALGPSVPNPNLNLAAIGLQAGGSQVTDANERVFVGGLPYYLTEEQCRELLGSFGPIKSFDLVKDRETGNSKGYGFVVYADPTVTDIACVGLNGMKMGDRVLTVRRATEGQPKPEGGVAGPALGLTATGNATRVVCLEQAVTPEELASDEEYQDIVDDMREECGKFGSVTNIVIPRPPPPGHPPPSGLGKVIVEFAEVTGAVQARNVLHGRKFGGRTVVATFMTDENFASGMFD